MSILNFDSAKCTKDGVCAAVCPVGLIEYKKGEMPKETKNIDETCIRCGHCAAACPANAITHRDLPSDEFKPIDEKLKVNYEQCEQFIRSRRSIRNYKEKSVPKEEIKKLIEIARFAPSGHNMQPVLWKVFSEKETLKKLSAIVVEWMRKIVTEKPQMAQNMQFEKLIKFFECGYDIILRNAPALVITHADKNNRVAPMSSTIALAYLELTAPVFNLGTCWAGFLMFAESFYQPLQQALELPENHKMLGALMLGYPSYKYRRVVPRKPPQITWE